MESKEKLIKEISDLMTYSLSLDMGIFNEDQVDEKRSMEESIKLLDDYVKNITTRLRADFENEKKRIKKVHEDQLERIKFDTLSDFTEIIDDLHLFGDIVVDSNSEYVKTGYILLTNKINKFLKLNKIKEVETSIPFNPDLHESVSLMDKGEESGTILKVVSIGYKIGEKIIKYPKVIVQS